MTDTAILACRALVAWFESERTGPDYGSLDRDTHPDGEEIWRAWWNGQLNQCDRAEQLARQALGIDRQADEIIAEEEREQELANGQFGVGA